MRPRRFSHPPRQGETLLDGLFRRLGLSDEARSWRAMAAWAPAAGLHLAGRARAERLRGSTLVVRVVSSSWAHELSYLKADLLAKLHRTPGGELIEDLRFTVGPLGDAPDWDEAPGAPIAPARPSTGTAEAPQVSVAETLEPIDDLKLAAMLAEVEDPELRTRLARLVERVRARR